MRLWPIVAAIFALGVVGTAVGFAVAPRQAAFSYLTAYVYALSTVAGLWLLLAMAHLGAARWIVAIRRLAEAAVASLPALALALAPLLLSARSLYPWATPEALPAHAREVVALRGAFHTLPAFALRSIAYVLALLVAGELLVRASRRQDGGDDPALATARLRRLSAGLLPVVSLALTFAAFDWLMSLEPAWSSTIFGVYLFAGGMVSAHAWLALVAIAARRRGLVPDEVGAPHFHALGTLLFGFVVFWAYIAFVQYLIVWIADLPHEVTFFLRRTSGAYRGYAIALVVLHFALPFFLLLFREVKARRAPLAASAGLLVLSCYLDVHWLVTPVLHPERPTPHLLDLAALAAVLGGCALVATLRYERAERVPIGDPFLADSLAYEGAP